MCYTQCRLEFTKGSKPMPNTKRPGRRQIYPWAKWFDNTEPFILRRHVHYRCLTTTFMQMVRSRALKDGVRVSLNVVSDNAFRIRVYKEPV
jgi:hypothetical protein